MRAVGGTKLEGRSTELTHKGPQFRMCPQVHRQLSLVWGTIITVRAGGLPLPIMDVDIVVLETDFLREGLPALVTGEPPLR